MRKEYIAYYVAGFPELKNLQIPATFGEKRGINVLFGEYSNVRLPGKN